MIVLASVLALAGCDKKKDAPTAATGSGSETVTTKTTEPPPAGSAVVTDTTMAGSGTAPAATDTTTDTKTPDTGSAAAAAPGARPASVTDEKVAVAEKLVATLESLAEDIKAVGTDCAKGTTVLKKHTAEVQKMITAGAKLKETNDDAARKWFKDNYEQRAQLAAGAMMSLAIQCQKDVAFMAAFNALELKKKKSVDPVGSGAPAVGSGTP